jgi:hypothetical protein
MGEGRADEVFKLIAAAPAQGIVLVRSVPGAASTKHLAPDAERYAGKVNTLHHGLMHGITVYGERCPQQQV